MNNDRSAVIYQFDDVKIECRNFQILKSGAARRITPRAFEVLLYLIENAGRVVGKDEFFEAIWKESFVSDNALTRAIKEIRRVIGDNADAPRYIETISKRGYRFIAASEALPQRQNTRETEDRFSSIAVLPFVTSSGDPNNEYLSEGITESLINNLSKLSFLRVVPRSTVFYFQNHELEPLGIGQKLNVRAVLTGRVAQRGEILVISTELIDVSKQAQIWGEQYHRPLSDIFDLQAEISQKIFAELQLKLNPEEKKQLIHRPTQNVEAYQLYLKGRYFWNRRPQGLVKGLEYFEQALEKDPDFALAYAGIADAYSGTAFWENGLNPPNILMPKACAAASRALEIDNTLAEAHATLGYVKLHYDWDLKAAEKSFRQALALNGNYAHAHHWLSHWYMAQGKIEESLESSLRALELEPLDIIINDHLTWHHLLARETDKALIQAERAGELVSTDALGTLFGGLALELEGDYDRAIVEFQKAQVFSGGVPETKAALGHALARTGETEQALKIVEELKQERSRMFVSAHDIAIIYIGLGEKELALNWLERAVHERSGRITYLGVEPRWDGLRGEARFSELIKRIGISGN
jgi:serine/threonine-protein kinase